MVLYGILPFLDSIGNPTLQERQQQRMRHEGEPVGRLQPPSYRMYWIRVPMHAARAVLPPIGTVSWSPDRRRRGGVGYGRVGLTILLSIWSFYKSIWSSILKPHKSYKSRDDAAGDCSPCFAALKPCWCRKWGQAGPLEAGPGRARSWKAGPGLAVPGRAIGDRGRPGHDIRGRSGPWMARPGHHILGQARPV
jgi:hypothetical protein